MSGIIADCDRCGHAGNHIKDGLCQACYEHPMEHAARREEIVRYSCLKAREAGLAKNECQDSVSNGEGA